MEARTALEDKVWGDLFLLPSVVLWARTQKKSSKDFWDSPPVLSMNHCSFSIRNTNYSQTLPPSYLLVFHGYILLPQCLNHPHLSNTHLPHQKPCVAHWYTHQFESIPPKFQLIQVNNISYVEIFHVQFSWQEFKWNWPQLGHAQLEIKRTHLSRTLHTIVTW